MRVVKAALSAAAAAGLGLVLLAGSHAQAGILLQDTFTYPDGPLVTVSGGIWATHSGTAGQVDVLSGLVNLTQAESEDVNSTLLSSISTGMIYFSFDMALTGLPSGTGGYFAHLKDAGPSNFRARVFATTTGAASGFYRLGIAAGGNTPAFFPLDLATGELHKVVVSYDVAAAPTPVATLYIDPVTETGGVASTDTTSVITITSFALRQSLASGNGMGTLTLDNLIVGQSFAEVVPEPASAMVLAIGAGLLAMRRRR